MSGIVLRLGLCDSLTTGGRWLGFGENNFFLPIFFLIKKIKFLFANFFITNF